jgi:serine/threonine protein kinase
MSGTSQHNAIYFPEGAGYLLVKVLQTKLDSYDIEGDVILVRSLDDNKLYIRKIVELSEKSLSGIPNEIEFNLSFRLIPRVKDITKYIHSSGEYYWAICTEHSNGGDVRGLFQLYATEKGVQIPEGLIWKFIADMIKIIRFLHEHRICHRDIGPRNIFMRYPHDDDSWPDFVLGDFGWAIPMQEDNCSVNRWLFLFTLFDLCTGMEEDDGTSDSHLSLEMCWFVKDLYDMLQKPSVDSLQYLTKKLLPLAESKVRKFRNLTVRPAATESSTTCKDPQQWQGLASKDRRSTRGLASRQHHGVLRWLMQGHNTRARQMYPRRDEKFPRFHRKRLWIYGP